MGLKPVDKYIIELKGICDSITVIYKSLDEDYKVINFAKSMRNKYNT